MIKIINRGWLQEKEVWKFRELREVDKNWKEKRKRGYEESTLKVSLCQETDRTMKTMR